jgi:hypothetical protein
VEEVDEDGEGELESFVVVATNLLVTLFNRVHFVTN